MRPVVDTAPADIVGANTLSFPVLIGDIGGTNARFAQIHGPDEPLERFPTVRTRDYATFSEAMRAAAADCKRPPRSAVIALAGPVTGDTIQLTNAPWLVQPKKAIEQLDLDCMIVLNDFEAQSLSLPALDGDDLRSLGGGMPRVGNKVVVGPGTGLGAAALVWVNHAWVPVAGEGGHMDLGPVTASDFALWPHLEPRDGRISGEAILSGSGMVRLYRGICAVHGLPQMHRTPEEVTEAGLAKADRAATETLHMFATCLGLVAGDLALVFMARGGVYLGGGISALISSVLAEGAFREAFCAKAPHEGLLEDTSAVVIVASDAALRGIETFVRDPGSFVMDLDERTWTP